MAGGQQPGTLHPSPCTGSGSLHLDVAEDPANTGLGQTLQSTPQPLRSTCSLPSSITGSTPRLLGEVLSMPAGPLPMSYSQKTWLPPGPTPMSRVGRRSGHSAVIPGLRGTESNHPCSHRRQLPLSYHPHLKTFCLGVDPSRDLGHKFLQLRRGLSVFSTSKQDQRGHITLMLKTGCWLWRGGVRFSPSGCRVDNSGQLGPPQCGSALLAHLGSLEVMASLHCLDV